MKYFVFISLAFLFACGQTRTTGVVSNNPDKVISLIKNTPDTIDLGTIISSEIVEYKIGVLNNDNAPAVILSISTDCGCTTTDFDRRPIKAGDTAVVTLSYDSKSQSGWQFKRVRIASSRSDKMREFYLTANVK